MNPLNPWTVCALYRFVEIVDPPTVQVELRDLCERLGICGTILLAPEGINGTIGAPDDQAMQQLIDFLDDRLSVRQGQVKYSLSEKRPFIRLKIRVKREIITMRQPQADPTRRVGTYVEPKDWNTLISDPDVVMIDTRNTYETQLGSFENAVDPRIGVFTEFADFVKTRLDPRETPKIAMFCTGGIRCEKASSYMLEQGFEEVYHLKGGILKYLEDVPADDSKWRGECFVFDRRVGIEHGLKQGVADTCYGCRASILPDDRLRAEFEEGVSCHHCFDTLDEAKIASKRMRHKHKLQHARRIGA